jgi:hypothetical protein
MHQDLNLYVMIEMSFTCPENIGEMASTEKGRFCDSCQKDIVDYSEMSNEEIQLSLQNTSGAKCGIFKKQQLTNRNRSVVSSQFKMAFILIFLMGMGSSDLYGQDTLRTFPPAGSYQIIETGYIIEGVVRDEDSLVVPLAKLWIEVDTTIAESGKIYANADLDGRYKIEIPSNVKMPIDLKAKSMMHNPSMVTGITFKEGETKLEIDITLFDVIEFHVVGMIYWPPFIPRDPYEMGKTKIGGEDIRW